MENQRRKTVRLQEYDYSSAGCYFVTICVKDRKPLFGRMDGDEVELNPIGEVAKKYWEEIPEHFENISLAEYVIMPNHIHGVIVINVGTRHGVSDDPTNAGDDRTCRGMSLRFNTFSKPIPNSLSVIVNQYKGSLKKWCNKNNFNYFEWQPRFYEHVIRNEESYNKIRTYIVNNPAQWQSDQYYNK